MPANTDARVKSHQVSAPRIGTGYTDADIDAFNENVDAMAAGHFKMAAAAQERVDDARQLVRGAGDFKFWLLLRRMNICFVWLFCMSFLIECFE